MSRRPPKCFKSLTQVETALNDVRLPPETVAQLGSGPV
jgi:hypothetical protein